MKDDSELYSVVVGALRSSIRESVERGLRELDLDPANADYLATRVMLTAKDEGAIDDMFGRLVKNWIFRNRDTAASILAEARKEDEE